MMLKQSSSHSDYSAGINLHMHDLLKNDPNCGIFAQTTHSHQALSEAPPAWQRDLSVCDKPLVSEDLKKDEGGGGRESKKKVFLHACAPEPPLLPAHYLTKRTHAQDAFIQCFSLHTPGWNAPRSQHKRSDERCPGLPLFESRPQTRRPGLLIL